jgi:diguanylate cyclase (GGDEF)-like protein
MEGGIQVAEDNPFFLRNGRELELEAGRYHLISELSSPFFLAQPEPYIDDLAHYRNAIKPGNAVVLVGLGIFLGLGIYYAALGVARRRAAEGMYSLFILGNFLYNGTSLLVFSDLLGLHWIYLLSLPILFSNFAYIAFVKALLDIRRDNQAILHRLATGIYIVMAIFVLWSALHPNESLEMDRYGVGLFLVYGLTAGIVRAIQGNVTARFYLIAIAIFFIFGGLAITQQQLVGVYTLYLEHVGLFAVAIEVILLALVLAYQFAQLHREKELISKRLEHSRRIAHTDALTGLPNRFVMDKELEKLPQKSSLTFIDLDRLKYYNDNFGHARGDELLSHFARRMASLLGDRARIFRVGGDEFAITCPSGDLAWIDEVMKKAVAGMHEEGFEFAGASAGSAHLYETSNMSELKHLADMRMYESKQQKQLG